MTQDRQILINTIQQTNLFSEEEKQEFLKKVNTMPDNEVATTLTRVQAAVDYYQEQERLFETKTSQLASKYSLLVGQKLAQDTGVPTPPQVQEVVNQKAAKLSKAYTDFFKNPPKQ